MSIAEASLSVKKTLWARIPVWVKLLAFLFIGFQFGFQWMLLLYFSLSFIDTIFTGGIRKIHNVYKRVTILMMLQSLGVCALVLTVSLLLITYLPFLGWSWLSLLGAAGTNLATFSTRIYGWGLLFTVLFIIAIPLLAEEEEVLFRKNTLGWLPTKFSVENGSWYDVLSLNIVFSGGIIRSILFGITHCLIGVPLGIGFALSIGGFWFTYQYMKGGVERSTIYHSTYNMVISVLLILIQLIQIINP
ncbi:hypothetical protein HGA88_07065 [Candidatus Roizmanbacteria bacterium]|nr:hypothetical protein [Candidatus Roizmanbacteria bacterium]